MTTRKFSFKWSRVRPFVGNVLYRNRGLLAFYWALSLLFLPAPFLLSLYRAHERASAYAQFGEVWYTHMKDTMLGVAGIYNYFSAVFYTGLLLLMPILVSAVLFSYMHNRRAADVYHALPLTREELFFGNTAAACVILLLPLAVNFLLMGFFVSFFPSYSVASVAADFFFWAAGMLAIYAITSFCSTQVGTVQDQVLFSLLVSVSPAGIVGILSTLAQQYLYGYQISDHFLRFLYRLCPFSLLAARILIDEPTEEAYLASNRGAAVWFAVGVVLLLCGARLYARRKSEQAEVVGNLGFLQNYARLAGTLIGGVCLAWVAVIVFDAETSPIAMLCFIALGSLITYYIGDFILARRVRGLRSTGKAAITTVLLACALCSMVIFDGTGYETRVPEAADVASIELSGLSTRYMGQYYNNGQSDRLTLTDADDIAAVLAAHTAQVAVRKENYDGESQNLNITYHLKSGRTMTRIYEGISAAAALPLRSLETSDEVLRQTAGVFHMEDGEIRNIAVTRASDGKEASTVLTAQEAEALVTALQVDLLNQPQSELENGERAIAYLDLTFRIPREKYKNQFAVVTYSGEVSEAELERYYSCTYRYLLTESFAKTAACLRTAGLDEMLTDSTDNLVAVGLSFYGSYTWSRDSYYVADGTEPCYDIWSTSGSEGENSPVVLLPTAEYEAMLRTVSRRSYYPNTVADSKQLVAILFYVDATADGGTSLSSKGGYYACLSDLSEPLQERVITAWCTYNQMSREEFEAEYSVDVQAADPRAEEVR